MVGYFANASDLRGPDVDTDDHQEAHDDDGDIFQRDLTSNKPCPVFSRTQITYIMVRQPSHSSNIHNDK